MSSQGPKTPTSPTQGIITSPRQILAKEQRRLQAAFHRRVVARDNYKCTMCGRTEGQLTGAYPDLRMLIADHKNPKLLGGGDETSNGQTFCFFDNLRYGWRSRYKKGFGRQERVIEQGE